MKKLTCIILVVCMVLTCFITGSVTISAADTNKTTVSAGSTEPQKTIQGSAILHCFDWSYSSIKANLKAIKEAGYTAVQTSPVQPAKDYSSNYRDQKGQWWKLYQPLGIRISESNQTWLGGKSELKAMCTEAEKYGIKVIVDVVANHVANKADGGLFSNVNESVDGELKRAEYYHDDPNWANDGSRWSITHGHIGMPDLNTGHGDIQNKFKNFLIDCINQGVDGFRFDAAKHIELPGEDGGSDFWPNVLNAAKSKKSDVYVYGEILNGAGTNISNYTKYMSITDNNTGDAVLNACCNGNASGVASSNYKKGGSADKAVLWAESHDTFEGESGSEGIKNTSGVSNDKITRAYAIIASRAGSSSLFFARPAANMGDASSDTNYKSKTVTEVNKFKNYFDGESEYLASEGDVAYNERGTSGVVISKMNGSGQVNLTAHKMKEGTYKDAVSGGIFEVSGGKISGSVGSSGVAVVYNATPAGPSVSISFDGSNSGGDFFGTASITLIASGTASQTYKLGNANAVSFKSGDTITIGKDMEEGKNISLVLTGKDSSGKTVTANYMFTKLKVPSIDGKTTVYYDNSTSNWADVYCYAYQGDGAVSNGSWPGAKMTKISNTIWGYAIDDSWTEAKVIFSNNGSDQDTKDGHEIKQGEAKIAQNGDWKNYPKPSSSTQTPTSSVVTPTEAATIAPISGSGIYGDANGDNRISIGDVTLIQKHMVNLSKMTSAAQSRCDVNSDNKMNIKDATCIQKYLAKIKDGAGITGKSFSSSGSGTVTPTQAPATQPPATQAPTASNRIAYFINDGNWSNVNIYYWPDGSSGPNEWPGVPMEKTEDGKYYASVPEDCNMIIFNNGSEQTRDIVFNPGETYNYSSNKK